MDDEHHGAAARPDLRWIAAELWQARDTTATN
jgi:hypothetical protein